MIRAVVFDLYETLITETGHQPTRASSLASVLGLEDRAYRREWKARRSRVVLGQLSFADGLSEISQTLSGKVDADAIQRICEQRIQEKAKVYARIDDEVRSMVADLARRGIKLAVISNGFKEDVVGWSTCELAHHFDCTVFSCVEGVAKPNPEIYLRALHRLGLEQANAVYIGDGGDDELAGAERAGLRACRAGWFVKTPPANVTNTEFAGQRDALEFVAAG